MSTRPTEPGFYWWRLETYQPWESVRVHSYAKSGVLQFERAGYASWYPLEGGIWGPRIPDPDEPRAEPTGGLTAEESWAFAGNIVMECSRISSEIDIHSMDGKIAANKAVHAALSAKLAEFGFTRLTDAEIDDGSFAFMNAFDRTVAEHFFEPPETRRKLAREAGIAAFRRAVAEARKPKGDQPC